MLLKLVYFKSNTAAKMVENTPKTREITDPWRMNLISNTRSQYFCYTPTLPDLSAFCLRCNEHWRKTYVHDIVAHTSHLNTCNKLMLEVGDTLAMPNDVIVSTLNLQQMFSTEITGGLQTRNQLFKGEVSNFEKGG